MRISGVIGLAVLMLFHPEVARAQDTTPFVTGVAGGAFSDQTSFMFGGRVGVPVANGLFAIGEVGRIQNVLPASIEAELGVVARLIELQTGVAASLEARVPVLYGMGGLRWTRRAGRLAPFAEGGVGVARLTLDVDAIAQGTDISEELKRDLADEGIETTKPLVAVGAGVNVPVAAAWSFDLGYRFTRIFTDTAITVHATYGAVVYKF